MTRCDRIVGGASRDRTDDLRVANATLSQLSYGPAYLLAEIVETISADTASYPLLFETRPELGEWWVWEELNLRPHPYQGCALTN